MQACGARIRADTAQQRDEWQRPTKRTHPGPVGQVGMDADARNGAHARRRPACGRREDTLARGVQRRKTPRGAARSVFTGRAARKTEGDGGVREQGAGRVCHPSPRPRGPTTPQASGRGSGRGAGGAAACAERRATQRRRGVPAETLQKAGRAPTKRVLRKRSSESAKQRAAQARAP